MPFRHHFVTIGPEQIRRKAVPERWPTKVCSTMRRRIRPVWILLPWLVLGFHPANAAEPASWYLDVQTYSFHEHTSETYLHNTTPGIGLLRRQEHWLVGAGVFRNSLGRWAGYGYGGYQWPVGPVRVGGIAGVTHHYDANNGGIVPLAAGVVTIPLSRRLAVDLIAIPRVANYTYATLNVSISWRLW